MFDRYNIIDETDLVSAAAKRFNGKVTAKSEGFAEQASQLSSAAPILRSVAQLVEHRSPKPGVAGSIPAGPVSRSTASMLAPALHPDVRQPFLSLHPFRNESAPEKLVTSRRARSSFKRIEQPTRRCAYAQSETSANPADHDRRTRAVRLRCPAQRRPQ